ncbi:MAG: DedA family protein [Patescibacteria group bacterium]|nr:DedA family protein [Patescibacteria group bacterium]
MQNWFISLTENPQLDPFTDWLGYFLIHNGIFAPMLLLLIEESGIPLPIPGDIYIAYTGYLVRIGKLSYVSAFVLLLLSVLIGASILYFLSYTYGQLIVLKFGKFIHLDEENLVTVEKHFRKYGPLVIIFGRHIPGFRIPITVFSGMSKVSYKTFIISTFISIIFWVWFYLSVGQNLGVKIFRLIHGNYTYFLLLLIPFVIFFGSIVIMHMTKKKAKADKNHGTI